MAGHHLSDLDELVLRCKDERARAYIAEAVACYHAGAFRACVVNTWIAVVFDFIHKLQQLDLTGDKNARAKLVEFERVRSTSDVKGPLDFERSILDWAKDEFEFISPLEHDDLKRLAEDRNRCAHPSMNSLDEVYQPTAELARYHLRNAVTHMLQRPPVQGKAALDRLSQEVESLYFPDTTEAAEKHFVNGPLARPRESLVRNFVLILLKELLLEELDDDASRRYLAALTAVLNMHREVTEHTFQERSNDIFRGVKDEHLGRSITLLSRVPIVWDLVEDDVHLRIETYVKDASSDELLPRIPALLDFPPLRSVAEERLTKAESSQLTVLFDQGARSEYVPRTIELYTDSPNFNTANSLSYLIISLIPYLSTEHVEQILKAGFENNQIEHSNRFPRVLERLRNAKIISEEQFDKLLTDYDLMKRLPGYEEKDDDDGSW